MFDWLINWLFPARPEYKPNIEVADDRIVGFNYNEAVKTATDSARLPTVDELQYLVKNGLVSTLIYSAWCKDNYNDVYAYVVYADGSRKKCDKKEFHQVVLVRDL